MSSSADDEKKSKRRIDFPPGKVFEKKESPLTELWRDNEDIHSAYNLVAALVILLCSITLSNYATDPQHLSKDIEFLGWAFRNFDIFWLLWTTMIASSYIPFVLIKRYQKSKAPDALATVVAQCKLYYVSMFFAPIPVIVFVDFSIVLKFAILCEQVRYFMKAHSFMSECTWMSEKKEKFECMQLKHLVYFLFAPTLIFRLEYPRTDRTSWLKVVSFGGQFFLTTAVCFLILPGHCQRTFSNFGLETLDRKSKMTLILESLLMGTACLFIVFYGILHCWLNMWAELLRFADRRFYDKWWLLNAYSRYYRQWNLVVHDWLHHYVYSYTLVQTGGNRSKAAVATFLISAVFHEYIITLALGFYYPILFVLFAGAGMGIYFFSLQFRNFEKLFGNVFLFFSISLGWSIQITLYASEYYARVNCPQTRSWIVDKLVPRSWSC